MSFFGQLISLSLLLHLGIIAAEKMNLRLPQFLRKGRFLGPLKKYFSAVIITTVAVIVFSCAGLIISSSVVDPHSNIRELGALLTNLRADMQTLVQENAARNAFFADPPLCEKQAPPPKGQNLMNTLIAINMPTTMEFRSALAKEYGMSEYHGTLEENIELTKRLQKNFSSGISHCVPGKNSPSKLSLTP